jgi:hypothetical protein
MSLNLFGKAYLAPDYLYDNGYNRILFSKERNQAEYLNYDSFNFPGLNASVIYSGSSILDLIGEEENQYLSAAHYLEHLHESGFEGRIYADEESWMMIFYSWIRITFPNIDDDTIFTLYNIIKQRENLVWPINRDLQTFMIPRLNNKNTNLVLNKEQLLEYITSVKSADVNTQDYYTSVNSKVKNDLSIEIQMASYLSNRFDIDVLVDKIQRFGSKILFSMIEDLKDYIRENIMTESVRDLTESTLSWDDQDWEGTLRSTNSLMDFLFNSSSEAIYANYDYRMQNISIMFEWAQWVVSITDESDLQNPDLKDIKSTAEYIVNHYPGVFSEDEATRKAAIANIIAEDVAFSGSTFIFQGEDFREKINTFLIEYVYQLSAADNVEKLKKLSHT